MKSRIKTRISLSRQWFGVDPAALLPLPLSSILSATSNIIIFRISCNGGDGGDGGDRCLQCLLPWHEVRLRWSTAVNHEVISGGSCSAIIRHLILGSSFLFLPCSVLGFTFALPRRPTLYLLFLPVLSSSARSCVTLSLFFVPNFLFLLSS